MGVLLVDVGLAAMLVGLVSLAKPLRFLRIRSRLRGAAVLALGVLLVLAGMALPAPEKRVARAAMRLDEIMPVYQFDEVHTLRVHAPPERVLAAARAVTAREIRLFRFLTWLRSPRRPGERTPENILAPSPDKPLLDVSAGSGFIWLAQEPDELVQGTIVVRPSRPMRIDSPQEFLALDAPGYAKATINFHVADEGGGWTRLTTETRVYATDPWARRRFAAYWRVIYPGSSLIRYMWLRAIRKRAEAPAGVT